MISIKKLMAVVLIAGLALCWAACSPPDDDDDDKNGNPGKDPVRAAGFVGSAKCVDCHSAVHSTWMESRHNNSVASPDDPQGPGIVADSNYDGTDDFRAGIFLGDTSVVPGGPSYNNSEEFSPMFVAGVPPVLDYDQDRQVPTVTIGALTYDVDYVVGGKWRQLYATVIGKNWYVLPLQYNPDSNEWSVFKAENWYQFTDGDGDAEYDAGETVTGPLYDAGQDPVSENRTADSWQQNCAGCHVTGLSEVESNSKDEVIVHYSELNITCEACHGPGKNHVDLGGGEGTILHPDDLNTYMLGNLCGRCHTRGESRFKINGQPLGWPWSEEGGPYNIAEPMEDYYIEAPDEEDRWADAARTPRMDQQQYTDFKTSEKFAAGVRCSDCHNPHGSENPAATLLDPENNRLCLSCHGGNGRGDTLPGASVDGDGYVYNIKGHTFPVSSTTHMVDPEDKTKPYLNSGKCIECHMPLTAKASNKYDIRTHHFKLLWPQESYERQAELLGRPNSCMTGECHSDLSTASNKWDPEDPNDLISATWMVSWGWPGLPPVASTLKTETQVSLQSGNSISLTLDGTASFDPAGEALTYQWYLLTGPDNPAINSPTSESASVNIKIPGVYLFAIEVTDTNTNVALDMVETKVTAP